MPKPKPTPSAQELNSRYSYDPATGVLMSNTTNQPITATSPRGYRVVNISKKTFLVHRIIWKMMTGQEAPDEVDHANLVLTSNEWRNIRGADPAKNAQNRSRRRNNTSGYKGVSWNIRNKKWMARITIRGKRTFLGLFDDPKNAHAAYCKAAATHFGPFARG